MTKTERFFPAICTDSLRSGRLQKASPYQQYSCVFSKHQSIKDLALLIRQNRSVQV